MTRITFSVISPSADIINQLLAKFTAQTQIQVELEVMSWDNAWRNLLNYAFHGHGPEVSQIGTTWTSSLVLMNTLRHFAEHELSEIGSVTDFAPTSWRSCTIPGDSRVWGIPWIAHTYFLVYWKDILKKAGVDETNAFSSIKHFYETLGILRASGMRLPWAFNHYMPNLPLLHLCSSWIWDAGGDFISPDSKRVLFNTPKSRTGLRSFLEMFRFQPFLSQEERNSPLFYDRKTAVTFQNPEWILEFAKNRDNHVSLWEQYGVTSMPGVPWVGGSNLVIWNQVQGYPERERAAIQLVKFLTGVAGQSNLFQLSNLLPARVDLLYHQEYPYPGFGNIIKTSFGNGRSYYGTSLWSRIENLLGHAIGNIIRDISSEMTAGIDAIITRNLEPLEKQLNMMLGTTD